MIRLRVAAVALTLVCVAGAAPAQIGVNYPVRLGLRAGAMVSPRGALLVGADIGMPTLSLLQGFQGRVDVDVITKANFGGINTIVPLTISQIMYAPNPTGANTVYYGAGLGAIISSDTVFDGKLILGMDLTRNLGAEANLHFTEHDTLFTLFARLKL